MILREMTTYLNGDGKRVEIRGRVKEYRPEFPVYWSLAGDWYWEDGRRLGYHADAGHFRYEPSWRDLVAEAAPEPVRAS